MLARLRWLADRLIGLAATIGALGLVVEVAVILADVTGRYFGRPLAGARDVSEMAMVVLVFGAMALCDRLGGHIAVDIFETRFPLWLRRAGDVASAILGMCLFLGIAWTVYESSKLSQLLNLSTNVINLPKVYFQWALSGFSVIAALGMALRAVELLVAGRDIREEPA
ncbi:TRAP transporter small permease [Chelativorans intermedius]|uniref:TRAP transporter small permease protein n=1 Tax=Chelativorans intermedius TaxID=515947 RepID=A0ABV6D5N0_9HYPH|nr:TRAP transporter small permease [Chelativorans intermedius]MCT8998857.1 TRAP transporter small permease [Chelativorans intermedius]